MRSEASFLAAGYGGDPAREIIHFIELGVDGLFCDFPEIAVDARRRGDRNDEQRSSAG